MPPPSSGLFTKAITIETPTRGRLRVVGSVRAATEMLLSEWPEAARHTPAHNAASRACLAFLAGTGSTTKARAAFLEAAKDADIFIREGR